VFSPTVACSSKQKNTSPGPGAVNTTGRVALTSKMYAGSCTKRRMLLSGASLLLAPLLAQHAVAKPSLSSTDSAGPSFNGFDGVGGEDADYANAEVGFIDAKCCKSSHC